jgi:hypothetical protein
VRAGLPWLTSRDAAILQALDAYRYLNRRQIEALFFTGARACQARMRWLLDHGLVRAWSVRVHPDGGSLPAVYVLARAGARALAQRGATEEAPTVQRALHAATRRFFLDHDLKANQFFVDLCVATRDTNLGVYQWVGPAEVRQAYSEAGDRGPIPDGWARLLVGDREMLLHVELDQGTEGRRLLRAKLAAYAAYFAGRRDAGCNQVLVIVPTPAREAAVQSLGRSIVRAAAEGCRFWTADSATLSEAGLLGAAWRPLGGAVERVTIASIATRPKRAGALADCIGRPRWWERRPGGGGGD